MTDEHDPGRHSLDTPAGDTLGRVTRFSGWHLSDDNPTRSIVIAIGGVPAAAMLGTRRADVAAAFPSHPRALNAGFFRDVVLPKTIAAGRRLKLGVHAVYARGRQADARRARFSRHRAVAAAVAAAARLRVCRDPAGAGNGGGGARQRRRERNVRRRPQRTDDRRRPALPPPGVLPCVRPLEPRATHRYGDWASRLIDEARGLVLDFGGGIQSPERLGPHVVNLDAIQFLYVDVVNTCADLPFRDAIFENVVSQAVFEHLPDPAQVGVQPSQHPSQGLIMQFEHALMTLKPGPWRARIEQWLAELQRDASGLDEDLGVVGREVLAAGYFVVARRPR